MGKVHGFGAQCVVDDGTGAPLSEAAFILLLGDWEAALCGFQRAGSGGLSLQTLQLWNHWHERSTYMNSLYKSANDRSQLIQKQKSTNRAFAQRY